jgi:phosphoenolpyruvate carboxylase
MKMKTRSEIYDHFDVVSVDSMPKSHRNPLDPALRELVHQSVGLLGEVVCRELGKEAFLRIEAIREKMRLVGSADEQDAYRVLKRELTSLRRLSGPERRGIAKAFTLMLELMNACENAFRSRQIRNRVIPVSKTKPDAIIYVLTAHPTEARSPQNIWVFHTILRILTDILERPNSQLTTIDRQALKHALEIAWRLPIVRNRKPKVRDEAEHIYSTLLRDETLRTLLKTSEELAPVYIRSWVGGDKDGHPGVDENTFLESLQLSRRGLSTFCLKRLGEVKKVLQILKEHGVLESVHSLESRL